MTLRPIAWAWGLAGALVCTGAAVEAQEIVTAAAHIVLPAAPPSLSRECAPKRASDLFKRSPLRTLRKAVRASRAVKVLAIGSSSTVGVGASSQATTYVAQLETTLEGALKGLDIKVRARGEGGEVAEGAAQRMKREVEQDPPDLVVWQVGTNDAIRQVSLDGFRQCLKTTLAWLKDRNVDVVLVDPQYGDALAKDAYYEQVVAAIAETAREAHVLLVNRFEAMRELAHQNGDRFYLASDNLHMNDMGHRCTAEQLTRSIVGGLLAAADAEAAQPAGQQGAGRQ